MSGIKSCNSRSVSDTAKDAAKTERSTRRAWLKSIESEESNRLLKRLLKEGVGTAEVEEYSQSEAGQRKRRCWWI